MRGLNMATTIGRVSEGSAVAPSKHWSSARLSADTGSDAISTVDPLVPAHAVVSAPSNQIPKINRLQPMKVQK